MECFASQIEFQPAGRGFVKILETNRGKAKRVGVLHYAMQSRHVGSEPVDVENARRLNEAADPLNAMLRELAGCREA